MPYYTPPGGDITAAYGRSLMGFPGGVNITHRRISPPPAVVAQQMLAQRMQSAVTMTGLGIIPSVNVRYAKHAIPAALASRTWRRLHPRELSGLGRGGGARVIVHPPPASLAAAARATAIAARASATRSRPQDVIAPGYVSPTKRQAGFFMGPGGGPGGGPFQPPGYAMSGMGMGLADDTSAPPDVGLPGATDIPAGGTIPSIITDTSQPAPPPAWFSIGKPTAPPLQTTNMAPPSVGTPSWVSNLIPALRPTTLVAGSSPAASGIARIGLGNFAIGLGAVVVLGLVMPMRKGRR